MTLHGLTTILDHTDNKPVIKDDAIVFKDALTGGLINVPFKCYQFSSKKMHTRSA